MMTTEKMKEILDTKIPYNELKKNTGIYEFYEDGKISIAVSYEDYNPDYGETYIFNLFWDNDEYINISNIGINDETINELVEVWNKLEAE